MNNTDYYQFYYLIFSILKKEIVGPSFEASSVSTLLAKMRVLNAIHIAKKARRFPLSLICFFKLKGKELSPLLTREKGVTFGLDKSNIE